MILLRVIEFPPLSGPLAFGVAVQAAAGAPWVPLHDPEGPVGFPTREEAQQQIRGIRLLIEEQKFDATGQCDVCGCTEDRACTVFGAEDSAEDIVTNCNWIAPGLCSACAKPFPRDEEGP